MQEGFVNYNTANYDPNALAGLTQTAILLLVVVDVSPSIENYVGEMNAASREVFIGQMKNSHRKDEIVVKAIKFNERVTHVSGFVPIVNLSDDYLDSAPSGSGTALYQAVQEGLELLLKYRTDLEDQGVDVRSNVFIITDGADNSSPHGAAAKVKSLVEGLRQNEALGSTFTFNMLGVGNKSIFEGACRDMGLDPQKVLVTVGSSGAEIRKQMGVVSQSISSSSQQAAVSF